MICIILLLLLLSLILFLNKNREGLDNCPEIKNSTTTGIINSANISSLKQNIKNINDLEIKITKNNLDISNINKQLIDILDIKQKVKDLSKSTSNLQESLKKLGDNIQGKGFAVLGITKEEGLKPPPILTDNSTTSEFTTN